MSSTGHSTEELPGLGEGPGDLGGTHPAKPQRGFQKGSGRSAAHAPAHTGCPQAERPPTVHEAPFLSRPSFLVGANAFPFSKSKRNALKQRPLARTCSLCPHSPQTQAGSREPPRTSGPAAPELGLCSLRAHRGRASWAHILHVGRSRLCCRHLGTGDKLVSDKQVSHGGSCVGR